MSLNLPHIFLDVFNFDNNPIRYTAQNVSSMIGNILYLTWCIFPIFTMPYWGAKLLQARHPHAISCTHHIHYHRLTFPIASIYLDRPCIMCTPNGPYISSNSQNTFLVISYYRVISWKSPYSQCSLILNQGLT